MTEQIHPALNELVMLNVIKSFKNIETNESLSVDRVLLLESSSALSSIKVKLDLRRLYNIGYKLMYDKNMGPIFTKCSDLSFIYNLCMYHDDEIPIESLKSYSLLKIKSEAFSP